jgi:hypothetical protein
MDNLVNTVTAFRTMSELRTAMDNGYVPTILPRSRRERILIKVLVAMNYRVFTG